MNHTKPDPIDLALLGFATACAILLLALVYHDVRMRPVQAYNGRATLRLEQMNAMICVRTNHSLRAAMQIIDKHNNQP